jgi:crotonobetainyl-CoA:carnitine CoA-transferase CaiB-like acyl-CoA transferase
MLADCLAGVRVLDLSFFIPGPLATLWMSDLGAEVVKVEGPAGDPMRAMGPLDADGSTPFYKLVNRNKSVVALDLKSEAGQRLFSQMLVQADVLMEAYRPGVMDRLGFGNDRLAQINPRLVVCKMSGYGGSGPFALRAGHDLTYLATTGMLAASGTAERPVIPFPPLADHAGAMLALNGILAALLRRGRTGAGAFLDIGLSDAALSWMAGVLTMSHRDGATPREAGMINGGAAFYNVYKTRDGRFVALAALEDKFWRVFCTTVGRPDWIARHGETLPQTALMSDLAALFASRTLAEWAALLEPADCTFEPVLDPAEVAQHAQHRARDFVHVADDGVVEVLLPMLMDGARARPRQPFVDVSAEAVLSGWR